MPAGNTQYKTVGVQWFASNCFSNQLFQRWIQTRSENPTVSYCKRCRQALEIATFDTIEKYFYL